MTKLRMKWLVRRFTIYLPGVLTRDEEVGKVISKVRVSVDFEGEENKMTRELKVIEMFLQYHVRFIISVDLRELSVTLQIG